MKVEERQKIVDILNDSEIIKSNFVESNGGESSYILIQNNKEVREELNKVGVSSSTIGKYGDDETFCVLALVFSEGYADDFVNGKFVVWHDLVDEDLRQRVLEGEGTATDAERLLRVLEPELFTY